MVARSLVSRYNALITTIKEKYDSINSSKQEQKMEKYSVMLMMIFIELKKLNQHLRIDDEWRLHEHNNNNYMMHECDDCNDCDPF